MRPSQVNRRASDRLAYRLRVTGRAFFALTTLCVVGAYVSVGDFMAAAGLSGCGGLALTGGFSTHAE